MEKKVFYRLRKKCDLMEITDEEDNNYYKEHSDHIHRYITVTSNKVKSFPTANIKRPT